MEGTALSPEVIRAEVSRFWSIFIRKRPELLEEFYDPEATVFASSAKRSEPGRLTVVRRSREYFGPNARLHYRLGKQIDVQLIGDVAAVVSYVFSFEAENVEGALGARNEKISHGRATQVFMSGSDGALRIVHEHFSTPTLAARDETVLP